MRLAFMSAGCYGDPVHGIQIADLQRGGLPDRIVLARSGPNGHKVPDFKELAYALLTAGYRVTPVMVYRKSDFALAGHAKHYRLTHEEARSYRDTVTYLAYELSAWLGETLVVIPYEPFVTDGWMRHFLFTQLGLSTPTMTFFNANEKYHLEGPPLPY